MNVAVLGCGPAGLIAADTAQQEFGANIDIFSKKQQSVIAGAQFMHAKTGWYCSDRPDFAVDVIKSGTAEGYAENVYGTSTAKTSWSRFTPGVTYGWDLKVAYARLWEKWEDNIEDGEVTHEFIMHMLKEYDAVISSVPLTALCYDSEHHFLNQIVHIVHGAAQNPIEGVNDNDMMYYNGHTDANGILDTGVQGFSWYRFSQLKGYQAWEYGEHKVSYESLVEDKAPWQEVTTVRKAVGTDCDCYDGIIKVGRYGCYDKSVLTHNVREQVQDALLKL